MNPVSFLHLKDALPCPFCGSTRVMEGYKYAAICVNCGATGPDKEKINDALKAWNTRKPWSPEVDRVK